jgi:hypothetical protein
MIWILKISDLTFVYLYFQTIENIGRYLTTNKAYGNTGSRDSHLETSNVVVGGCLGTLHFIRFSTAADEMKKFIELAKLKGMAKLASTVCATGGKNISLKVCCLDVLFLTTGSKLAVNYALS